MHQHPRQSPTPSAPRISAGSPRDQHESPSASSPRPPSSGPGSISGEGAEDIVKTSPDTTGASRDGIAKLNQIVQNYFTKAALIILNARAALPPAYAKDGRTKRVNKWFNVEVDETDVTRDVLRPWKNCDSTAHRPPPLIIETYIDLEDLTSNQSLVFIDDTGKRWDVEEALRGSPESSTAGGHHEKRPDIILERWSVQLGSANRLVPDNLGLVLPRTYKNSIVLFRSLYAYTRLLPAWRFGKRLFTARSTASQPRLRYRILQSPSVDHASRRDNLALPLYRGHADVVDDFSFEPIETPAGLFSIQAIYRTSCDFRIADSEALLSSRFMGLDDRLFVTRPANRRLESAPQQRNYLHPAAEIASPPRQQQFQHKTQQEQTRAWHLDAGQAYGSLSTFHQPGAPAGTSPLSALRAAQYTEPESPDNSMPRDSPQPLRSAQGSRSSLRSNNASSDGYGVPARRPSVSFMPFKAPSLSASPSQQEYLAGSIPRGASWGKASPLAVLAEARHPSGPPPMRGLPMALDAAVSTSPSNSPRPQAPTRYSSSFGHRRNRLSTGGSSSRTEDDNSSGKASASSVQPESGVLTGDGEASSGSLQTDDDNISDFIKLLEQKKDLRSFSSRDSVANEASVRRTNAALNKFQRMRDSNAVLSESMSSSLMLHRSSSSSSRQLSSVPPMVAGTSMSTSSSPGKPISPHTPHTPAIPSRLSANSIAEYGRSHHSHVHDHGDARRRARPSTAEEPALEEPAAGAIDIPTSPRPFVPNYRRSSSAVHRDRASTLGDDDDIFPFVMRSASLGVDDRLPLDRYPNVTGVAPTTVTSPREDDHHHHHGNETAVGIPSVDNRPIFHSNFSRNHRQSSEGAGSLPSRSGITGTSIGCANLGFRARLNSRTDTTDPTSSFLDHGSVSGSGSNTSSSLRRGGRETGSGGRYSFSKPVVSSFEDEEPLLFAFEGIHPQHPSDVPSPRQAQRHTDTTSRDAQENMAGVEDDREIYEDG